MPLEGIEWTCSECTPVELAGLKMNSLSWADDLVLISSSAAGLQHCLNKLEIYCYKWNLEVNNPKTKCMVFRSHGSSSNEPHFTYNGQLLESVDVFTYLGVNISSRGSHKVPIEDRTAKARRAANMCKQALLKYGNSSTNLAFSIFDRQIAPILTYASPIWGTPTVNHIIRLTNVPNITGNASSYMQNLINSRCHKEVRIKKVRKVPGETIPDTAKYDITFQLESDKLLFLNLFHNIDIQAANITSSSPATQCEKVHTNFLKFVLNVSKFTSNDAVRYELGRHPIENRILYSVIKYWLRMAQGTQNHILNKAYECSMQSNLNYIQSIKSILYSNGYGYVWEYPQSVLAKPFARVFLNRLNDQFQQKLFSHIKASRRFETLTLLKPAKDLRQSDYLCAIHDLEARNIITKIQLDTNCLRSCRSRRKSSPADNGEECNLCHGGRKSVTHFVLTCPYFEPERQLSTNTATIF